MKRIVLFCPSHKFGGSVQPRIELPLCLLTIATPLDRAGYDIKIIDQRIDKGWRKHLLEEINKNPICVGITSMTGPQIRNGLEASRLVRQHGDIPIVWGGIHPTLLPRQTLENENIDIVVQGEGEKTFFELVQALEKGKPLSKVKGIWYKENGEIKNTEPRPFIDLNEQPPLSYHLVDVKKYLVTVFGQGHLSFESSRGCPFKCTYCYNTKVYNSTWRGLTVDETIKRIKTLIKDYGVKGILFSDDNFFGNKERAMLILKRIKEEKLGILCSKIDGHISVLSKFTDSELNLLRDSGCKMLMIGVESGSSRIIEMMKKELRTHQVLEFNRRLVNFNIMPLYFFMMGYPTETLEELNQTISLNLQLKRENKGAISRMNIYTPFPGTGLFDISVENGLKVPERLEDWVPFNYRTVINNAPWLSKKRKKIIRMLHCTILLAEQNSFITPYKKTNPIVVLLAKIYNPIAKMRVENLYYKFPIEIKLAECLGLYPRQGG
jgi:anaerobic magnesium-protoporphyrin IX monomethyl ester cyclase